MFWSKNKKKVYTCKPQFYFIKVGCKGVFVIWTCFGDEIVLRPYYVLASPGSYKSFDALPKQPYIQSHVYYLSC